MMAFHFHKKNQAVWVRNGGIKDSNLLKKKVHFRTASRLFNSNSLNICGYLKDLQEECFLSVKITE